MKNEKRKRRNGGMTVLQYPGKKNSIAQWIINHFPHDYQTMTYLEPFFGSGSVFFRKERSAVETINDVDSEISNLFLQIRNNPDELILLLLNTPWSRTEYDLSFEKADNPIEQARRCIVRYWFTVGANVRKKNGMRFEIKRNAGGLGYFHLKLPDVIAQASERLKHDRKNLVQIENRNVFELIPVYDRENVLMYLDPPYLLETRKNKKVYCHEFTDEEHEELLKLIACSKAKIIISGYMNELYSCYLNGWRMEHTTAKDQAGNNKTECIWMNYSDSQSSLFNEGEL
jgi:DNA adenine methylase